MTVELGRFGHHPDPAIDFCEEVDIIEGLAYDVSVGLADKKTVEDRIFRASMFRVGGICAAVDARKRLLLVESVVGTL